MSFDIDNAVRQARLLPPRQKQVLRELANGNEQKEIAALYGVSKHTVKNTVSAIYGRLGIHNQCQATHVAIKAGLVK